MSDPQPTLIPPHTIHFDSQACQGVGEGLALESYPDRLILRPLDRRGQLRPRCLELPAEPGVLHQLARALTETAATLEVIDHPADTCPRCGSEELAYLDLLTDHRWLLGRTEDGRLRVSSDFRLDDGEYGGLLCTGCGHVFRPRELEDPEVRCRIEWV